LSDIFKPLFTFGKSSGTGLGLASVAKVVNEHGGQINVMNLATGVEFSLRLKASDIPDNILMTNFKTKSEKYSYELKNKNEDTGNRHLRILLLDDDRYVYEYFQDLIKKISFEVELVHVGDVDRAREVLKSKRFDLYILDYDLGSNMTGLDFYHENLYFLKSNVVLHSNRDISTINNLDILLFSKPMSFETLTSLCEEAFQTRLRILLVEDSKLISLAWKMFHGKHNIHCVSSPEEALKFLGSDPDAVEICVLDYYYDGIEMNGVELGDKIILLYPEMKIVISTSAELLKSKFKILKKNEYEFRRLVI
jgi:DNA-binding NtrC family response regulator